jgi:hypothetical protein
MAKLLFRLNNVPDDEANAVRELLNTHNIACYETDEGKWRVGLAAIWLKDEAQYAEARTLLDEFQQQHATQALNETPLSTWEFFKERPLRFVFAVIAIAVIVFISTYPFLLPLHGK